jgi:LPXTG-motif cell wall-anchored protein
VTTAAITGAVALVAPAAQAAPPASGSDAVKTTGTVTVTNAGYTGPDALDGTCHGRYVGNDADPTKVPNGNDSMVPGVTGQGWGKVEGGAQKWASGKVNGMTWTFVDKKTIEIRFSDTFAGADTPISDILVKGGNSYSVCSFAYRFQPGDVVTINTDGILVNNGGNAPAISHVSFYPGNGLLRNDPDPTEPVTTPPPPITTPPPATPGGSRPTTTAPPSTSPAPAASIGTGAPAKPAAGKPAADKLPATGSETRTLAFVIGGLVLLGTAMAVVARRRTASQAS